MKILRICYDGLSLFTDGKLDINFTATDKVIGDNKLYELQKSIYTQANIALIGINATGKTTALKLIMLALKVVLSHENLNTTNVRVIDFLKDNLNMTVYFFDNNQYYKLSSTIKKRINKINHEYELFFSEEVLESKSKSSVKSKKDIFDFTKDVSNRAIRSKLAADVKSVLRDGDSLVIQVTKDNKTPVLWNMLENDINCILTVGETPIEVLRVFDPNIEYLKCNVKQQPGQRKYEVRFKNADKKIVTDDLLILNRLLSSGTIKGQNIVRNIIFTLINGGYLIIDELENHLNKQLVQMIIDIFASNKTNPNGACLVFSTHYAEILDSINRKDNLYILRKDDATGKLSASNYASEVKRNDIKKSEMIISNSLKGTAPFYEDVKALKDVIRGLLRA